MRSALVLEMLNNGKIEDLKVMLQDEIYTESLKGKPNAKKRYSAMKKYLKTCSESREILQKPCEVEFEGERYNAFCNAFTLALTTENCGEITMCDDPDRYPDVARLVRMEGDTGKIDFSKVLAEAKSKGYKFTKSQIFNNDFLMHYEGSYFRIGLVDVTYGIIDDGSEAVVYNNGANRPITVQNSIGICVIMPVRIDSDDVENEAVVIVAK